MDLLETRFNGLCNRYLSPNSSFDTDFVCQDILQHYDLPNRRYHNRQHLNHCLQQFDEVADLIPHPDEVELALWFHDSIYIPGRSDNEQKSCDFFLHHLQSVFPINFERKIEKLILATTHKFMPTDIDERYIADIDLSSFGFDWGDFLIDSQNIREERMDIHDSLYFQAHTQFLKHLMTRGRIFQTDFFYNRFENTAKQNITRLLLKRKSESYE